MATPTIHDTTTGSTSTTTTTFAVAYPAVSTGDVFLLWIVGYGATSNTIATPSGWTVGQASFQSSGSTNVASALFWKAYAAESGSLTVTVGSGQASGVMMSVSGANTTAPINVSASGTAASGTAAAAPTVTPGCSVASPGLLLTSHGGAVTVTATSGATYTKPAGMTTEVADIPSTNASTVNCTGLEVCSKILTDNTATGSQSATASATSNPVCISAVIQAADTNRLSHTDATLEDGIGTWVDISGIVTLAQSTDKASEGTHSLKWTTTGTGQAAASIAYGTNSYTVVRANQIYSVVCDLISATVGRTIECGLTWYNGAKAYITDTGLGSATSNTSTWTQVSLTNQTAPPTAAFARMGVFIEGVASGEVHYSDKAGILDGVTTTWADPTAPPVGPNPHPVATPYRAAVQRAATW